MTIGPAVPLDAARLAALHATCFDKPWSQEVLSNFIVTNDVLIIDDPLKGFIIARQILDEAEIITLAVEPGARQNGTGTALLDAALAKLAHRGARKVFLEVASDNGAAIALYRKFGFVEVGMRKAYYARAEGPPMAASVMSRALDGRFIASNS